MYPGLVKTAGKFRLSGIMPTMVMMHNVSVLICVASSVCGRKFVNGRGPDFGLA